MTEVPIGHEDTLEDFAFKWFCMGFAHAGEGDNGEMYDWDRVRIEAELEEIFQDYWQEKYTPFQKPERDKANKDGE